MKFRICDNNGTTVAAHDLADNFVAQTWAIEWVRHSAEHDTYSLESEDGRFAMTLLKTNAGQWYRMPKLVPA